MSAGLDFWARGAAPGPATRPLLLLLWALLQQALAQDAAPALCRPQEGLPLSQPFPPPYFVPGGLPLCSQYTCSCCSRTHALALYRGLRSALEDPAFSRPCAAWLTRMACRVCDPEVGTGVKPHVCVDTCDAWHDACKDEFFAFSAHAAAASAGLEAAGGLRPCAEGAAGGEGPLLCSRLRDVAGSGEELCREAGLTPVNASSPDGGDGAASCFDGGVSYRTDMCVAAPPPPPQSGRHRGRGRSGGVGAKDGQAEDQEEETLSPAVYFVAFAVVASLLWLGYTTRQGIMAGSKRRVPEDTWTDRSQDAQPGPLPVRGAAAAAAQQQQAQQQQAQQKKGNNNSNSNRAGLEDKQLRGLAPLPAFVKPAAMRFRELELNYLDGLSREARLRIANISGEKSFDMAKHYVRSYGDVAFTLAGVKPCALIAHGAGPWFAQGIAEHALLPVVAEFGLEQHGFVAYEVKHKHRTSNPAHPGFQGAWVLANRNHPMYATVWEAFMSPPATPGNVVCVKEQLVGKALGYPLEAGGGAVVYGDATEAEAACVPHVPVAEYCCPEWYGQDAVLDHFVSYSRVWEQLGRKLALDTRDHGGFK